MKPIKKVFFSFRFIALYLFDLAVAAFRISLDTLTVKNLSHPGVIHFPLEAKTDFEITLIANLITFSPGTMVVGLTENRETMLIHSMFMDNEDEAIEELKQRLEKRVLELLR